MRLLRYARAVTLVMRLMLIREAFVLVAAAAAVVVVVVVGTVWIIYQTSGVRAATLANLLAEKRRHWTGCCCCCWVTSVAAADVYAMRCWEFLATIIYRHTRHRLHGDLLIRHSRTPENNFIGKLCAASVADGFYKILMILLASSLPIIIVITCIVRLRRKWCA